MDIDKQLTDEAILSELGARLAGIRLEQNRTQGQVAESAGVSKRTVERLEGGYSVQLHSLIRVFRELDLINRLNALIPEPIPSPIARVKLHGKSRRRASSPRTDHGTTKKWTWGKTP